MSHVDPKHNQTGDTVHQWDKIQTLLSFMNDVCNAIYNRVYLIYSRDIHVLIYSDMFQTNRILTENNSNAPQGYNADRIKQYVRYGTPPSNISDALNDVNAKFLKF